MWLRDISGINYLFVLGGLLGVSHPADYRVCRCDDTRRKMSSVYPRVLHCLPRLHVAIFALLGDLLDDPLAGTSVGNVVIDECPQKAVLVTDGGTAGL